MPTQALQHYYPSSNRNTSGPRFLVSKCIPHYLVFQSVVKIFWPWVFNWQCELCLERRSWLPYALWWDKDKEQHPLGISLSKMHWSSYRKDKPKCGFYKTNNTHSFCSLISLSAKKKKRQEEYSRLKVQTKQWYNAWCDSSQIRKKIIPINTFLWLLENCLIQSHWGII